MLFLLRSFIIHLPRLPVVFKGVLCRLPTQRAVQTLYKSSSRRHRVIGMDICLLSDYSTREHTRLECGRRSLQSGQKCAALSNEQSPVSTEVMHKNGNMDAGSAEIEKQMVGWEKRTNDLVQLSTFPFLFLSIPQVLQNAVNLTNGNLNALSILSWKARTEC